MTKHVGRNNTIHLKVSDDELKKYRTLAKFRSTSVSHQIRNAMMAQMGLKLPEDVEQEPETEVEIDIVDIVEDAIEDVEIETDEEVYELETEDEGLVVTVADEDDATHSPALKAHIAKLRKTFDKLRVGVFKNNKEHIVGIMTEHKEALHNGKQGKVYLDNMEFLDEFVAKMLDNI